MKLQQLDEIRSADLNDAPEWVEPVLTTLNTLSRSTYQAIMGRLSIDDNLDEELVVLPTINSNNIPSNGYSIKLRKLKAVPKGCILVQARLKNEAVPTNFGGSGFVDWRFENGLLKIYNINGLSTSDHYIVLRVF
jgi:hypothetical protein